MIDEHFCLLPSDFCLVSIDRYLATPHTVRMKRCFTIALLLAGLGCSRKLTNVNAGRYPEQLVYVRSADGVVNGGVLFTASTKSRKPVAVIWIHGWGVNFYQPSYTLIGRALAERGYTCIEGNTRMHDIGTVQGERFGKRVRGGGYWGKPSEEVRDLSAWMALASDLGFKKVVLVGHSAGWAAVRAYQAERQDERVVGMVNASGAVRIETRQPDPGLLAQAKHFVDAGEGEELIRLPNRKFPSFVSAQTYLDIAQMPDDMKDFFGIGIKRVDCPILAFFGTRESDVGTKADLDRLPKRVKTTMIERADHMYTGEEAQVADTIANWMGTL